MRKTKIVATIGPASASKEIITSLIKSGVNVVRCNFSHETHEEHQRRINIARKAAKELKVPLANMNGICIAQICLLRSSQGNHAESFQ